MWQKISNILKVFALLLLSLRCEAQKFEWVNFFGGKNAQVPVSMTVDSMGNQYATFFFNSQVKFDTSTINQNGYDKGLVVKQNKDGKVLWYKIISSVKNADALPLSSLFNNKGNLLVFIESKYDLKIGEDTIKKISKSGSGLFLIEFSTTGKIVNRQQLIETHSFFLGRNSAKKFTSDKYDNIYINLHCHGTITVYDKSGATTIGKKPPTSTGGDGGNYFLKFSNSGQKFEWYALISPIFNITINSLKVDVNGDVYATTCWHGANSFSFSGKTISNFKNYNTGFIFIWDKNGKEKNCFSMAASGNNSRFIDLAVHDSNSVFISGVYEGDTARFDTIAKKNRKFGCYYFMARYHANGRVQWVKTEDTTYGGYFDAQRLDYSFMVNYKDTFFYLSFYMDDRYNQTIIFDGQKYMPNPTGYGINMKVDERGNILWAFRTSNALGYMGTDDDDNLYFQGLWNRDTIKFGSFKSYPIDAQYDGFIGKTFDYSIYRGKVNAGPYCAGDSFYVPYTKMGDFADSNIFFAEISDEFGNFTGKEREIVRIKSKNNGTIRGVLPMFKVASSGNYRIRIRSTSPQAQSFYKKDTLRLLIYSRDKANPGPPEWICKGDTIKLNTYGGTKWKWSPKYRMDDPNLRQPLVWPIKDTTYKIIIADSSGCGAPDTAYKKIFLRKNLKAVLAFTDTGLCKNTTLKIPVHFMGGDSNYHWESYNIVSPKSWTFIGQGQLKQNDTLVYFTNLDSAKRSEKLALIVWDECNSKHDTVFINLNLRKPEFITSKFRDTLVCYGVPLTWTATTKAPAGTYHWQWKDMLTGTVLSTYDFLKLKPTQILKIKLSLIAACNEDASVFFVSVRPPLETKIFTGNKALNDTTLCDGQSLKLYALGKGGDTTGYKFKWYTNGTLISTDDTLIFNPGSSSTLQLILTDNCTSKDDSISNMIKVIPAPKADFTYEKACSITPIQFTFKGTKPGSPLTTAFEWDFAGTSTSTAQDPSQLISTTGKKKIVLTLTSSNGCSDIITKEIDVKPQSKADFSANDVCETDSVVFINKSKDATSYTWKFGDGQTISTNPTTSTQKHKYQINGISTTYNVTLVALVTKGCSDSVIKAVTVNENPKSDFTYSNNGGKVDFKATQTGAKNYRWLFGNGDSAKVTNPDYSYTYKKSASYNVCLKIINTAGCQSQTCKQLSITGGISPIIRPSGFKIYPNPNTGNFTLEIENASNDVSIEVYDLLGNLIKALETNPDKKSYLIEISVAKGIYLVKVRNNGMVYNQKVMVSSDGATEDN